MKKVFSAPSVIPCDFLKALLEAEGIPCFIRNEFGTHLLGYGFPVPGGSALPWAWPEVWIPEEDMPRAQPLIDKARQSMQRDGSGEDS